MKLTEKSSREKAIWFGSEHGHGDPGDVSEVSASTMVKKAECLSWGIYVIIGRCEYFCISAITN